MSKQRFVKPNFIPMNLDLTNKIVGDHGITFDDIFNLVKNTMLKGYKMVGEFPNAARVLKMALQIGIKDNKFYHVTLGDFRVLICYDYLGNNNVDRVCDLFIVDGIPTIFIFADSILTDKARTDVKVYRIMNLFITLTQLMSTQEYMNLPNSIYAKVFEASPVVLTVKLIKEVYGRDFNYDKDWNPDYYDESFNWFNNQVIVNNIYKHGKYMLDYGAITLFVDDYLNNL